MVDKRKMDVPKAKGKSKVSKLSKLVPSSKKGKIITVVAIIAIIVTVVFLYQTYGLAIRPTSGTVSFQVLDPIDKEVEDEGAVDITNDVDCEVFEKNIADLSSKEIGNLDFEDYEIDVSKRKANDVSVDIDEEKYIKYAHFSYKGSNLWLQLSMPEEGNVIVVYMFEETDDINHLIYCDEDMSTTFASATEKYWTILVDVGSHKGLMCGYLFDEDEYNSIVFIITFDAVPVEGDANIGDFTNDKQVIGNTVIITVDGNLQEEGEFSLTLSDDVIAGSPNTVSIEVGFGQYDDYDVM